MKGNKVKKGEPQNPLPPISPGTPNKPIRVSSRILSTIKKASTTQSPQETQTNSMAITAIQNKRKFGFVWRPNNYRRQIEFEPLKNSRSLRVQVGQKGTIALHTKLIFIKDYKEVQLQVGRTKLTATHKQRRGEGGKMHYHVQRDSLHELGDWLTIKKNEIREQLDVALRSFCKEFKLRTHGRRPRWERYEDFVKGEEFIDNLPQQLVIHDTVFKKVYGQGIEFVKDGEEEPTVRMKNYIKNRALEDVSPEIVDELKALHNLHVERAASGKELQKQLVQIMNVMKGQAETNLQTAQAGLDTAGALKALTTMLRFGEGKPEKVKTERPDYIG